MKLGQRGKVTRRVVAGLLVAAAVPAGTAVAFEWVRHPNRGTSAPVAPKHRQFTRTFDATSFLKGNLHTHTNRSDGDSSPAEVIGWYRSHGYRFLALTDHNQFSDPARFASLEDEQFRLISGEEITMSGAGRQVHVNALCTERRIGGGAFASPREALVWASEQILAQHGVAIINHPNFDRALMLEDLLAVQTPHLLEIMSGHPYVYSDGVGERPSAEVLWDRALATGNFSMGVAVDDLHHLNVSADPAAYPGRGWVEVFGQRNDPAAICKALHDGLLYSSDGPSLDRVRVTETNYEVTPAEPGAQVTFVGRGGRELFASPQLGAGETASYTLRDDENDEFVRARVVDANGAKAWTPSVATTETSDVSGSLANDAQEKI